MSLRKRCTCTNRCQHVWYYDFRVNGRRYRACTETSDKHRARDIESTERTRILEGKHGIRRQPDITLREFWPIWLENYAKQHHRESTLDREQHIWRVLDRHLGSTILHEITSFTIEQFKAKRRASGCKPGTIIREGIVLSGMLHRAVEWKYLVTAPRVTVQRSQATRTRILSPDEQRRLLVAYDRGRRRRRIKPLIELLLATAARLGELTHLQWQDIDDSYLWLYITKNGKARRLPLTQEMRDILSRVEKRGALVFLSAKTGKPYRKLDKGFKAAVRQAGIQPNDVVIHTLRHTAISRMMDANIDPRTIMEISGHSSLAMLERYTHPREQRKIEALEAINRHTLVTNRSQTKKIA